MDEKTELFSLDRTSSLIKKNLLVIVLLLAGIILVFYGAFQYLNDSSSNGEEIEFIEGEDIASDDTLFVDVSGAVMTPGLYELKSGERIQDAIDAAGGLKPEANSEFIASNLNRAQPLTDGMKLYIPLEGEEAVGGVLGSSAESSEGLVSINSGSASELETLPQIGPARAQDIIDNRPYSSVDDLLIKKVVGAGIFDEIKDLVSL